MTKAGGMIDARVKAGLAPSPVDFAETTYVFWQPDGGGIRYMRRKPDGKGGYEAWSGVMNLGEKLAGVGILDSTNPAAIVYRDRLHVFWYGIGRDGYFHSSTTDGEAWSPVESVKAALGGLMGVGGDHSPCVTVHEGWIHLFWRGLKDGEGMFHAHFDGSAWHYAGSLQDRITHHGAQPRTMPAAIGLPAGPLMLFWSGSGKDGLFTASLQGGTWNTSRSLRDHIGTHGIRDGHSPVVSGVGHGFYLFWNGSGNDGIYWTRFDNPAFDKGGQRHIFKLARIAGTTPPRAVSAPHSDGRERAELYWRDEASGRLYYAALRDRTNWMSRVEDATPIGALNLPGTHDSAAIDRGFVPADTDGRLNAHPYDCQNLSVGEQLALGVRVLDIRVQIVSKLKNGQFAVELYTCHGSMHLESNQNRYQSFESAIDEIRDFLSDHPTETVVAIIKIDDERSLTSPDTDELRQTAKGLGRWYLVDKLNNYGSLIHPWLPKAGPSHAKSLPTLGELRGKIFLLDRIEDYGGIDYGHHLHWSDNPQGELFGYDKWKRAGETEPDPAKPVRMALQDRYENVSRAEKIGHFLRLSRSFPDADVLLNYASYTHDLGNLGKPLIQEELMEIDDAFGLSAAARAGKPLMRPGWTFFDFVGHYRRSGESGQAVSAIDYVLGFNNLK